MPKAEGQAEVVLRNARIYTVDPKNPWATAIAIRGDRIIYIGNDDRRLRFSGPKTQIIGCRWPSRSAWLRRIPLASLLDQFSAPARAS